MKRYLMTDDGWLALPENIALLRASSASGELPTMAYMEQKWGNPRLSRSTWKRRLDALVEQHVVRDEGGSYRWNPSFVKIFVGSEDLAPAMGGLVEVKVMDRHEAKRTPRGRARKEAFAIAIPEAATPEIRKALEQWFSDVAIRKGVTDSSASTTANTVVKFTPIVGEETALEVLQAATASGWRYIGARAFERHRTEEVSYGSWEGARVDG